ncbi:putative membrane protein, partial [Globisporangium splendens]
MMLRTGWRYPRAVHAAISPAAAAPTGSLSCRGRRLASSSDSCGLVMRRAFGTNVVPPPSSSPAPRNQLDRRMTSSNNTSGGDPPSTIVDERAPLTGGELPIVSSKTEMKNGASSANAASSHLESTSLHVAASDDENAAEPQLSWRERAKTFAIEYGRVGVCTHIVLSIASFSTIYVVVSSGVDVSAMLNAVGYSVSAKDSTTNSAGSFVIAYAMYKLLSPVRWPLTFAVTPVVMRALRKRGYMLPAAAAQLSSRRSSPTHSDFVDRKK